MLNQKMLTVLTDVDAQIAEREELIETIALLNRRR